MQYMRLFLFAFFLPASLLAGDRLFTSGARSGALGGDALMLTDIWSVFNNQAGLPYIRQLAVGYSHRLNHMTPGLGESAIAIAIPTGRGTAGISLARFGFNLYNEQKAGIAYGIRFSETFSAGIQLNYHRTGIADVYGSRHLVIAEGGMLARITDKLWIGAHILNPTLISHEMAGLFPVTMRTGLLYKPDEKVLLPFAIVKGFRLKPSLRTGLEYLAREKVCIRLGLATAPARYTFGVRIVLYDTHIDLATSIHQVLGTTPMLSVSHDIR